MHARWSIPRLFRTVRTAGAARTARPARTSRGPGAPDTPSTAPAHRFGSRSGPFRRLRPPRRRRALIAAAAVAGTLAAVLAAPGGAAAAGPEGAAPPAGAGGPTVTRTGGSVVLTVPPRDGAPGYRLATGAGDLALTTSSKGRTVLATAGGGTGALRFHAGGGWQHATAVTGWTWRDGVLTLTAGSTLPGATVTARITPAADRYQLDWSVTGGAPDQLGLAYDLASAGHWYGHGETKTPAGGPGTDQPWPLERGQVHDAAFGPASYDMIDPFWYTSSATGLRVDTGDTMDVAINSGHDGLGRFTLASPAPYHATVFVESTPLAVYRDYVGIVGKPAKSDATYEQYAKPLWNSWAQFYTKDTQQGVLDWAGELHAAGLLGHTVQLDDRWESEYGNLTFDPATFPDPKAMSDRIHAMGAGFGLWVTLWINLDSANYRYAADHGYLLKSATDPAKPCTVSWWNGTAGIVDLANPDAAAWYTGNLATLMKTYGVDGFKFDTRFFDERCAPDAGHAPADYQRLGAGLADRFDLQGAGIRVHWSSSAHQAGFVTRQVDKGTGWNSLAASVTQNLAISTIGYPFVETDMIGGSSGQPPATKDVLVRWAQSAALMPLMYASTSPVETTDVTTGRKVVYDQQTIDLYRAALQRHARLAPYLWAQVQHTLATGDPIMRPLFFDFPHDRAAYTVTDEWMLGPSVLAAPQLAPGATRTVHLPPGVWFDVARHRAVRGPATLTDYPTPLTTAPVFIRLGTPETAGLIKALT